MRARPPETAVAAAVVAWLEQLGADVYQEVGDIDIVADGVDGELWVVETKVSPSLAVLTQAMKRTPDASRVIVATTYTAGFFDFQTICGALGLGLLRVDVADEYHTERVTSHGLGKVWNTTPTALRAELRPEHKTHARAGTNRGGSFTRFRQTCTDLSAAARAEPGITLNAAIAKTKHHYAHAASARQHLTDAIERGLLPGIELAGAGRHARLVPTEAK